MSQRDFPAESSKGAARRPFARAATFAAPTAPSDSGYGESIADDPRNFDLTDAEDPLPDVPRVPIIPGQQNGGDISTSK